jgi:hypothetical protein
MLSGAAGPAFAEPSASFKINKTSSQSGTWRGAILATYGPGDGNKRDHGSWKYLATKWKAVDNDKKYDYWAINASVQWTTANPERGSGAGASFDNKAYAFITSNISPSGKVWDSAGTQKSTKCVPVSVSIGIGYGIISGGISTTSNICSNSSVVTRHIISSKMVRWTAPDVSQTRAWAISYMEKVPQGKVPKFVIELDVPNYTITYDKKWGGWRSYFSYTNKSISM